MKHFIRTNSGLQNYPKFFGVDVTVFIEGKKNTDIHPDKSLDEFFYEAVSKALAPEKKFKFKILGNKLSVLKHAEIISSSHGAISALAIVDKDLDSFNVSLINRPNLHYTYSYSWENDLLSYDIAIDVLSDLTPLHRINSKQLFAKRFSYAKKRIELISTLDAVLQVNGETLITKNRRSCGIEISDSSYVIKSTEMKRLIAKYKTIDFRATPLANQLLSHIQRNKIAQLLVQGHLWCSLITKMISDIYKRQTSQSSLPIQSIINLTLSKFSSNPLTYMNADLQQHYRSIFN